MRGIANAARNLNASIQNDTLIITRLGYDFETGEEREEPFVKIPLVQIQSLADVLAVDYMYAEMMLIKRDYRFFACCQTKFALKAISLIVVSDFDRLLQKGRLRKLLWGKKTKVFGYKEVYFQFGGIAPFKGYAVFSCLLASFCYVCGSVGKWISPTKLKTISTF